MRKYVEGKPFHHFYSKADKEEIRPSLVNEPTRSFTRLLKNWALINVGTHTMRKTFGYKYYNKTKDVGTLQKMFNHSSPAITLRYIGIEQAELDDALRNFVINFLYF